METEQPWYPALVNQVIPCQLEAYRATLLPGKMLFIATTPTNHHFHGLTSPAEPGLLPPLYT